MPQKPASLSTQDEVHPGWCCPLVALMLLVGVPLLVWRLWLS
jgi:hypothetical protein